MRRRQDAYQHFTAVVSGDAPRRLKQLHHRWLAEHELSERSSQIRRRVALGEFDRVHEVVDRVEQVRQRRYLGVVAGNPVDVA